MAQAQAGCAQRGAIMPILSASRKDNPGGHRGPYQTTWRGLGVVRETGQLAGPMQTVSFGAEADGRDTWPQSRV